MSGLSKADGTDMGKLVMLNAGKIVMAFLSKYKTLVFGLLLLFVWCLLRLPWITCDGGIPSVWEYGYYVTDEGYYLSGGKEKYLWNAFVDLDRIEAFTYGFSPGTHILSWLSHLCFGLSVWSWRVPFMLVNLAAWLALFNFIAKKTRPLYAFFLCVSVSCTPMIVAYERTASNDVLIGSLLVLSYVVASCKGRMSLWFSALIGSAIILVKPSVYVLLPVVAAGILSAKHYRNKWIDVAVFFAASAVFIVAFRILPALLVYNDAVAQNATMWDVVKKTTTHYPLPDITDIPMVLKGLSNFPRDPSGVLLGVWIIVLTVCPVMVFCKNILSSRWSPNMILYVMIPAYIAGISIMNTLYTHYFIPVMMMIPVLWMRMREDLRCGGLYVKDRRMLKVAVIVFISAVSGFVIYLLGMNLRIAPDVLQRYYARIYNFSTENIWFLTFPYILSFAVCATVAVWGFTRHPGWRGTGLLLMSFFVSIICASVCFAQFPAVLVAPLMQQPQSKYLVNMMFCIIGGTAFILFATGAVKCLTTSRIWFVIPVCGVVLSMIFNPAWQNAATELLRAGTHYHQKAAVVLKKILPPNAIVIGERSNQMLMSLPIRSATTFPTNSDPIPIIEKLAKKRPDVPLFALIDSQHSYCVQHYEKNKDRYVLIPVHKFRMPSFGTGKLSDVHLCFIKIVKP